jgi:hypothetical protein
MESLSSEKICPRCGAPEMKDWRDLTEEQKFLIERLPRNTDFTPEQRKKHRFCERCWFEEVTVNNNI